MTVENVGRFFFFLFFVKRFYYWSLVKRLRLREMFFGLFGIGMMIGVRYMSIFFKGKF